MAYISSLFVYSLSFAQTILFTDTRHRHTQILTKCKFVQIACFLRKKYIFLYMIEKKSLKNLTLRQKYGIIHTGEAECLILYISPFFCFGNIHFLNLQRSPRRFFVCFVMRRTHCTAHSRAVFRPH